MIRRRMVPGGFVAGVLAATLTFSHGVPLSSCSPPCIRGAEGGLAQIDVAVNAAIAEKQLPGAVVVIVHHGEIIYKKAFGRRTVEPAVEPMTADTLFDLASLTKPIATATSIMLLVERGKLKPEDCAAQHLARFGQ